MLNRIYNVVLLASIASTVGIGQQANSTSTPNNTPPNSISESMSYSPRVFEENDRNSTPSKRSKEKSPRNQREKTTFSTKIDRTLEIPVSVIGADGAFLGELKNEEFKAFVDGGEVEILAVERGTKTLSIILLLDTSASSLSKIDEVKDLANRMVNYLHPGDAVMVAKFDTSLRIVSEFTTDRSVTSRAIKSLKAGNGTSLYDAVQSIFERHSPKFPSNTAIVIISDGVDTTSQDATYEKSLISAEKFVGSVYPIYLDTYESSSALKNRVLFPTIPGKQPTGRTLVGSLDGAYALGKAYLTDLLRLSGGRSVLATDVLNGQDSEYRSIPIELRSRYILRIRLPGEKASGRLNLRIRINRPGLTIFTKTTLFN